MTLFAHVVDSSSDVSSDCLIQQDNKFWSNPPLNDSPEVSTSVAESRSSNTSRHTTTVVAIADEPSNATNSSTSYEYTIENSSSSSNSNNNKHARKRSHPIRSSTDLTILNPYHASTTTDSTKRYQTKMLLASLIEHFCRTYGDTPDANRKVFFLICQTLRSLGIIDAEFVDEMTSVRSSFQQAFHKLFYTAVQTVRNQDLMCFDDNIPRLIKPTKEEEEEEEEFSTTSSISSESDEEEKLAVKARPTKKKNNTKQEIDYFSSSQNSSSATAGLNVSSPGDIASKLSSSANTLHSFMNNSNPNGAGGDFFHNLRVQNSRYDNDFVEMVLLGKGGFASAFRARNKLDGIDYAVKKIRLGTDIESGSSLSDSQNPYEKIFREIKNLARLEHINVIRYYSSWLEYDDSDHPLDESEWEGDYSVSIDASCKRLAGARKNSFYSTGEESSVFDGRDPTFTDDDEESSLGIYPQQPSESGMSHIQFGNDNSSSGGAGAYNGGDSTSSMSYSKSSSFNNKKRGAGAAITQQSGWTLFIQMQLCPTTLHDYIRFRNKQYAETLSNDSLVDTKRNIEIFSQILQGTAYIHDQGLIHRDLKPSNIFLSMSTTPLNQHHHHSSSKSTSRRKRGSVSSSSTGSLPYENSVLNESNMWEESWVPKIGDFGLAAEAMDDPLNESGNGLLIPTPITSLPPSPVKSSFSNSMNTTDDNMMNQFVMASAGDGKPKRPKPRRTRTIGVGTRTYASPEQLAIPAQPYDEKVDIYSLGIILFELFQPFATGMERADSLEKLKQGVFPTGFLDLYPKVSALIIWMMDEKADHRPTAHQLLEFELFSHPEDEDIYLSLQQQLQNKSNVIDELKKKLEKVELEKLEMSQKMDEMQKQLAKYKEAEAMVGIKKCISSPLASFKKKKEVRWSTLNAD